eukprot:Clim_evm14s200 gene=Clim_evmTU14s200
MTRLQESHDREVSDGAGEHQLELTALLTKLETARKEPETRDLEFPRQLKTLEDGKHVAEVLALRRTENEEVTAHPEAILARRRQECDYLTEEIQQLKSAMEVAQEHMAAADQAVKDSHEMMRLIEGQVKAKNREINVLKTHLGELGDTLSGNEDKEKQFEHKLAMLAKCASEREADLRDKIELYQKQLEQIDQEHETVITKVRGKHTADTAILISEHSAQLDEVKLVLDRAMEVAVGEKEEELLTEMKHSLRRKDSELKTMKAQYEDRQRIVENKNSQISETQIERYSTLKQCKDDDITIAFNLVTKMLKLANMTIMDRDKERQDVQADHKKVITQARDIMELQADLQRLKDKETAASTEMEQIFSEKSQMIIALQEKQILHHQDQMLHDFRQVQFKKKARLQEVTSRLVEVTDKYNRQESRPNDIQRIDDLTHALEGLRARLMKSEELWGMYEQKLQTQEQSLNLIFKSKSVFSFPEPLLGGNSSVKRGPRASSRTLGLPPLQT